MGDETYVSKQVSFSTELEAAVYRIRGGSKTERLCLLGLHPSEQR